MIKDNNENILKSLHIFSSMKNKNIFEYQIMCPVEKTPGK